MEANDRARVPHRPETHSYRVSRVVQEHIAHGYLGSVEELSPEEADSLLQATAQLVAQAFAFYGQGDLDACDRLVAQGWAECGEVFAEFAEHVTGPDLSYRVDDAAWDAFLAWLAVKVRQPSDLEPTGHVEAEDEFLAGLHRMVHEGQGDSNGHR